MKTLITEQKDFLLELESLMKAMKLVAIKEGEKTHEGIDSLDYKWNGIEMKMDLSDNYHKELFKFSEENNTNHFIRMARNTEKGKEWYDCSHTFNDGSWVSVNYNSKNQLQRLMVNFSEEVTSDTPEGIIIDFENEEIKEISIRKFKKSEDEKEFDFIKRVKYKAGKYVCVDNCDGEILLSIHNGKRFGSLLTVKRNTDIKSMSKYISVAEAKEISKKLKFAASFLDIEHVDNMYEAYTTKDKSKYRFSKATKDNDKIEDAKKEIQSIGTVTDSVLRKSINRLCKINQFFTKKYESSLSNNTKAPIFLIEGRKQ